MAPLERRDLGELHCIQPFDNVASILDLGILSNYEARRVQHRSIASALIQARRERKVVPGTGGRRLHSYANLYINARNKMLSKITYDHGDLDVCVLRVSCDVLGLPEAVISSQNASSDWATFAPAPGGLARIDKESVFARSWKHPQDQKAEWRHGSIMCAEVLVPDVIPPEYIDGAYVSCPEAAEALQDEVGDEDFAIELNPDLFFRP